MTVDEYFDEIEEASLICMNQEISNQTYVERLICENVEKITKIIELIKSTSCPSDYDKLNGYLEFGWFYQFQSFDRLALYSFMFDIGHKLKVKMLQRRFEKYDLNQPLFSNDTEFFSHIRKKTSGVHDFELIEDKALNNIFGSEVFERDGIFFKTDQLLKPSIYAYCRKVFNNSPIFIRLDPTERYLIQPPSQINEDVLIPANPNWWQSLKIYKNQKEGSSYILYPKQPSEESYQELWEFHVDGIRRLDVVAKRNNAGNLSMMLEELSDKDIEAGITIGRCIHLDTDNPIGTSFSEATVNHLDLAINIYDGESSNKRYNNNLATGTVVENATFRTHLFRIENIPLKSIIYFASVFFQSKTLRSDWLEDQFGLPTVR